MFRSILSVLSDFFLGIFYPKRCVNCGEYGRFLCFDCASKVEMVKTMTCPECGKISKDGRYCNACRSRIKPNLSGILFAAKYGFGPTKKLVSSLKYDGIADLSVDIAEIIFASLKDKTLFRDFIIVPVPLHISRKNLRGFNQSELIARELSKLLNLPGGDVLVRTKNTSAQVGFDRRQRLNNISGAFCCDDNEYIAGKNVLLVDDILTTGATLNECAKVLKDAGAKRIWAIAAARNIK